MDPIANSLGMKPLDDLQDILWSSEPVAEPAVPAVVDDFDAMEAARIEAEQDFALVRNNLRKIMTLGSDLFDSAGNVALNTEGPDQFKAASAIMDSLIKANRELMANHKDRFALMPPPAPEAVQQANTINNIVFNGNSVDMIDWIRANGLDKAVIEAQAITGDIDDQE